MSRLSSMSPAALRAVFAPESDADLILLLTITGPGIASPIRLADGYTQRLSETDDQIVYGVRSRGQDYLFLPMQITLPTDEQSGAPRASIALYDVTRELIPVIRTITSAPSVLIELVLSSSPDTLEASFPGLLMADIPYNADAINVELSAESQAVEPFPQHTMTPAHFPGLF